MTATTPGDRQEAGGSALAGRSPAERYLEVRSQTVALAQPLSPEEAGAQSMAEASPVKWHLAHTTWFFETFLLERCIAGYEPIDPAYRILFNSYYNSIGEQHPRSQRGLITRPGLEEVLAYRSRADDRVARLLDEGDVAEESAEILELGLQHEQQHQELILTDLKHLLWSASSRRAYAAPARSGGPSAPQLSFLPFDEGLRDVGCGEAGFSFDNERPRHRVFVHAFALGSRPVTCGDYLEFMREGGYERPELWLADGWEMIVREGLRAPLYWEEAGGAWKLFTLRGEREVDPAEPVCHVSYYEADAFARWAGARLPTEMEWEVASGEMPIKGNFLESGALHPLAAAEQATNAPLQLFGDVWEWTGSAYLPYPGYRPLEGSLGEYNGKFMCNQMVLRGGSCASPRAHLRRSYRNFFYARDRWQFMGFRLAKDLR